METCFGEEFFLWIVYDMIWSRWWSMVLGRVDNLLPWLVTGFSALIDGLIVLSFPRSVKKLIFINSPFKSGASSKAKKQKTKKPNLE